MQKNQKKTFAVYISITSNSILVLAKIFVGLAIGSVAILSEAIHSAVDLLASFIALFAVKESAKPADTEHPFGHGKFENISGAIEAFLIFVAGGWIIYESIKKLIDPSHIENASLGVIVMLASAVINFFVSEYLIKVAKETDSIAVEADGWHLRTDVYTSAGVSFGLLIVLIGAKLFPSLELSWVDPAIAIAVAVLILKAAYDLTRKSVSDLLDMSLPKNEEDIISTYIHSLLPEIRGFHNLKTRKSGGDRFIEFHIKFDPETSVQRSHDISHEISEQIKARLADSNVIIHIEPCSESCNLNCDENCKYKKKNI
ncbi:MAG: cation diffusion facilitator family transporter [Armatimonadota bacterium]